MQCPKCGFENRDDARFCKRCGNALQARAASASSQDGGRTCPACGAPAKPNARFCPSCGKLLTDAAPPPRQRPPQPHPTPPPRQKYSAPPSPRRSEAPPPPSYAAPPPSQPASWQTPAYEPPPSTYPAAETQAPPEPGIRWLMALIAALLIAPLALCAVVGLTIAPALGQSVPPGPEVDPTQPDITIRVKENYLNSALTEVLPKAGTATLDVRPGNQLVITSEFDLFLINLRVIVTAGVSVEEGRIQIWVDSIETGGENIFDLLGVDNVTLGEDLTDTVQEQLEAELGEGAQLLQITTDEEHIILTARWQ